MGPERSGRKGCCALWSRLCGLGLAVASGEAAFGIGGAEGHVLWRVFGQHSRVHGQTGNETLVTRRVKVGVCPCCSSVSRIASPGAYSLGAHYAPKEVVMQLCQAYGPWGARRYSAFHDVAENGYLPKDWDSTASTLSTYYPRFPYLFSSSMGGICDLVAGDVPPLRRTVPDFAGVPLVTPNAENLSDLPPNPLVCADGITLRDDLRVPSATPKPPPPVRAPSENAHAQPTDFPSDSQSEWFGSG